MDEKTSGNSTASGRGRRTYQAPVIVPLGEMAKSVGAACSAGLSVFGSGIGLCRNGAGVRGQCTSGNGAAVVPQP